MHKAFMLWNPINLVDGEGKWFFTLLWLVVGAAVFSKVFAQTLTILSKRINNSLFPLFAESIFLPVVSFVWYVIALVAFDLVTDGFLTHVLAISMMVFVRVGFVITLGWSLLRFKNKLIKKTLEKNTQSIDKENLLVISKVLSVVVVILMVLLLSDVTGISVTTSLALGGIGGLALAFASQEIVANFFGGLMIHIMKPFSLGDYISIPSNEIEGVVEEIGWYQTTLRSLSNEATYVSNSLFTKGYLINKSRLTRRLLSESFFIRLEPIDLIPLIIQDITTYLNQHPSMQGGDKAEDKANVWLKSIQGTTSEVAISSSTDLTSLAEFNRLRDEVLLKIAFLVALRGGQLMPPPSNS